MHFYLLFLFYLVSLSYVVAMNDSTKNAIINYMENVVKDAISLAGSKIDNEQKMILEGAPKILSSEETKNVENWLESMAKGILCTGKYQKNEKNQNGIGSNSESLARMSIKDQPRIRRGILEISESQNGTDSLEFLDQFCSDLHAGRRISEVAKGIKNAKFLMEELSRDSETQKRIEGAKLRKRISESEQNEQNSASKRERFMDRVYLTFDEVVRALQNQAKKCQLQANQLETNSAQSTKCGRRKRGAGTSPSCACSADDVGYGNRQLWKQVTCTTFLYMIVQCMRAARRLDALGQSTSTMGAVALLLAFNFILHCIFLRHASYGIDLFLP